MTRWSLAGRATAALAASSALAATVTALAVRWLPPLPAALCGVAAAALLALWLGPRITRPWVRVVRAVRDGIVSLHDRDFSLSIAATPDVELSALTTAYNSLGEVLRRERLDLYQRELLLDTVIQQRRGAAAAARRTQARRPRVRERARRDTCAVARGPRQ